MRYEAQYIMTKPGHWRVTDTTTDSRVATCYVEENAEAVVAALNASGVLKDKIATIAMKARAGLCCLTHAEARVFLKDILNLTNEAA